MNNLRSQQIYLGTTLVISLLLASCFAYTLYERFLKWIDCFNEKGRCYDPITQTIYITGGWIWSVPAMAFGVAVLVSGYLLLRTRRRKDIFSTYHHNNSVDDQG